MTITQAEMDRAKDEFLAIFSEHDCRPGLTLGKIGVDADAFESISTPIARGSALKQLSDLQQCIEATLEASYSPSNQQRKTGMTEAMGAFQHTMIHNLVQAVFAGFCIGLQLGRMEASSDQRDDG